MAESIVYLVLETFRDLLIQQAKFSGGISAQIDALEEELETMKSFLKDADAKQHEGDVVCSFVRQIRNLAYRAQDVLEEYAIEVTSKKRSGVKKLLNRFACMNLHNIESEIYIIKIEISNLKESLVAYGMNRTSDAERVKQRRLIRRTFAHQEDEHFVGMEDDIKKLVCILMDEGNHKVVSIYGMGGSGKTTMARSVFNHPQAKQVFDAFAWVCITQTCEITIILQDLLKQLSMGGGQSNDFNEMVRDISKVVTGKKCLIVLDDIWKIDDWRILSPALQNAKGQSKVLLTTRKYNVANVGFLYQQRLLSEAEGLKLLEKKAINQNGSKDSQIEELFRCFGREMVNKCGGLPLAISALGGILQNKFCLKEWEAISQDIGSTLNRELIDLENSQTTEKVLALSYDDLPHFLKPCFLYLSAFNEDENIDPVKLYHMWIAEGMVSQRDCLHQEETLMDVAERFLKELNSRSMIQVQMDPILGELKSCRLHDLVRDLCVRKAKEEEFLERIDMDNRGDEIGSRFSDTTRRLIMHSKMDQVYTRYIKPFDQIKCRGIRALSFQVSRYALGEYTLEASSIANMKTLRVLNCIGFKFHEAKLPNEMCQLIHLTYLSLNRCTVKELPSFVGDLPMIQTLDLRTNGKIWIPHDIFLKKKRLKHLYLGISFTCGSNKNLQLTGLLELETLVLGHGFTGIELSTLSHLANLRHFKVDYWRRPTNWPSIIDNWTKIKRLEIDMWSAGEETVKKAFMSRNITWLYIYNPVSFPKPPAECNKQLFCPNLVELLISKTGNMDAGTMEFLGKFPKLRKLTLMEIGECVEEMDFDGKAFPELRYLELSEMSGLQKIKVKKTSLQNLIRLKILGCKNLEMVPEDGLRYLHKLRDVHLGNFGMSGMIASCRKHHHHYPHVSIRELDF